MASATAKSEKGKKGPARAKSVRRSIVFAQLPEALWPEYRRRLSDDVSGGHTLADVRQWLAEQGVAVSTSPIYDDRLYVLRHIRQLEAARETTEQVLQLAKDRGSSFLEAGSAVAGQKILDALISCGDLEPTALRESVKIIEALTNLRAVEARAQLVELQSRELREKFDRAANAASGRSADGRLSPEQIASIREEVFGR